MTQAETIANDELETTEAISESVSNDAKPKRRGRPPGSKNKPKLFGFGGGSTSGESTAQRSRPARGNSRAWIREQWAGLIGLGNMGLLFISKDDALNEPEMDALADAMVAETMSSDRIMRWMTTASKITPHILLANVLVAIAIPRLRRRGMLPAAPPLTPEQEQALNEYLRTNSPVSSGAEGAAASDYPGPSIQVETGGTPFANGQYR